MIEEAIKYIDELHEALMTRIQANASAMGIKGVCLIQFSPTPAVLQIRLPFAFKYSGDGGRRKSPPV